MKRASRIVTDSEFSRQEIIRYFRSLGQDPCGLLGVNTEKFHPVDDPARSALSRRSTASPGLFLYLGTVDPKNLERLIRL
ncbi:MAG: hypothetical protein ACLUOF_02335 [Ruminococcus sp.]